MTPEVARLNRLTRELAEIQALKKECSNTIQGNAARDAFEIQMMVINREILLIEQRGGRCEHAI